MKQTAALIISLTGCLFALQGFLATSLWGADLPEIRQAGALRHLGVPYANFVTGSGDGLDAELIRLFAGHLGVSYQFVETSWTNIIQDLSGKQVEPRGDEVAVRGDAPVRGDIAACGLTILPWRQKVVNYSRPTFPTQVWLVVSALSRLRPITPSSDTAKDVAAVKAQLQGVSLLGMPDTCLDPHLYGLGQAGASIRVFDGNLNELIPAIIAGKAEGTLQDAPDALIAVKKWAGKIKIIGPVSPAQSMAVAFSRSSPELQKAFNRFLEQSRRDGTYTRLVRKYYPGVFAYYPDFFENR